MKTYQKTIIISVLLVLAVLIYISKNKTVETLPIEKVATTTDTIIRESTDFYDISVEYPKEPRDKDFLMEKDVLNIVNVKKEEWKIGGGLHQEEQNIANQFPDRPFIKYELNIKYDKYESKERDIISYVFKNYEFTGGAHGNTGLIVYNFNKNGLIKIGDILNLTDSNSQELINLIKEKLKSSLGEMYNQDILDDGLNIYDYKFDDFVVLDEGIKFIFGQYQVAPYAAGMPEVVVSWEELKSYLK